MSNWQQGPSVGFYPGQDPPPAGFQVPGGYPQPGYSQPGYPQSGYPQPGYPQPGYQQPGNPQAGYPKTDYPQPGQGGYQPGAPPAYDSVYGNHPSQPDPNMYGTHYTGEPAGDVSGLEFSEKTVRLGFIRKVYGILMSQLLVSLGFIALFLFHNPTKEYVKQNQWLWGLAFAVMVITLFSIACCGNVRRKAPMNFIFLGLFTVSEGFLLGVAASTFRSEEVFLAVAITAVVCFSLTVFAFQTKWDFTLMRGGLFVCCIVLFVFGLFAMFSKTHIVTLVYSCLAALLFSLYLIFDTQMMIGGTHKYSISPEEYVFAALTLYLDIVNIFMSILTIIGSSRD